ncbi:WD40-repeat-containing domain protein [Podospora australis]|uniref:Probable cytosolic iron-sulfur protein assembly protein 1 n=1 Tax=Podospora australis TaxID=1536484 RepID=A0AAN6WZ36_9PEZI|nr:WD40-repeat-containing domain protein [Podospora australis]
MAPSATITPLPPFQPDLYTRAWSSTPHPTLPLIATAHEKSVTVFSLSTLSKHSSLTGGHARSVRSAAWQPSTSKGSPANRLRLVTASFDSTAGLWSYDESSSSSSTLEKEIKAAALSSDNEDEQEQEWEFNLVLEGHENEVKSLSFSPSGQYLATCSRDKTVWIWEDVGAEEDEYEWETVAVLSEHDGDVKCVAFAPHIEGRKQYAKMQSQDCLASASYDDTVRIWREDAADGGEWVCVSVLEGHGGTVWGLQWEGKPREKGKFPRLLTNSADATLRVWTLKEEEEDDDEEDTTTQQGGFKTGFGAIPNSMRRSLREEWECTAVLPKVHTREVYSAAWSAETGIVASTGSDGKIVLYQEDEDTKEWKVIATVEAAHGPYEINHITWCKRFDASAEKKGEEEMLVTTGDDGVVRPWEVRIA